MHPHRDGSPVCFVIHDLLEFRDVGIIICSGSEIIAFDKTKA
jgi:hypothetical protein